MKRNGLYCKEFETPSELTKFVNDDSGWYVIEEVQILYNSDKRVYVLFYKKLEKQ